MSVGRVESMFVAPSPCLANVEINRNVAACRTRDSSLSTRSLLQSSTRSALRRGLFPRKQSGLACNARTTLHIPQRIYLSMPAGLLPMPFCLAISVSHGDCGTSALHQGAATVTFTLFTVFPIDGAARSLVVNP